MRLFHRTRSAKLILSEGFRDAESHHVTDRPHRGVCFCNVVSDVNERGRGEEEDVLEIHLPNQISEQYEWIETGKAYREFLVPATVVNSYGPPRVMTQAEIEAVEGVRLVPRPRLRHHQGRHANAEPDSALFYGADRQDLTPGSDSPKRRRRRSDSSLVSANSVP